jgi:predicted homoserine dehydrogenase-like protein
MNPEIDGTVGPLLKTKADKAGVVISNADGDQPGVQMNLFRFVQGIGVKPVLCGNIKGLAGPLSQPHNATRLRRQMGTECAHGHVLRGRNEGGL